jgi:hypothetical protein
MIIARKMKQPMQYQYPDLLFQRMAEFPRVRGGNVQGDGNIPGKFFDHRFGRRKREHIRGFGLAAKVMVEPLHLTIRRKQYTNIALQADSVTGSRKEALQARRL